MELFDKQIDALHSFLNEKQFNQKIRPLRYKNLDWPSGDSQSIVFLKDTAIDLGNPRTISSSFLLWKNQSKKEEESTTIIIGPDVKESRKKSLPFGKVILIGGTGFKQENTYSRYRELGAVKFDICLDGCMMRAASYHQNEWIRISHQALQNGFSLEILGNALIRKYMSIGYVTSVKVIFVTSSIEDVARIRKIGEEAFRIQSALTKMANHISFDCENCEYNTVCQDVAGLRALRNAQDILQKAKSA